MFHAQGSSAGKVLQQLGGELFLGGGAGAIIIYPNATDITAAGVITGGPALPSLPTGPTRTYLMLGDIGGNDAVYYALWTGTPEAPVCTPYIDAECLTPVSGITPGAYNGGADPVNLVVDTSGSASITVNGKLLNAVDYLILDVAAVP